MKHECSPACMPREFHYLGRGVWVDTIAKVRLCPIKAMEALRRWLG